MQRGVLYLVREEAMYILEMLIARHRDIIEQETHLSHLIGSAKNEKSLREGIGKIKAFFDEAVMEHINFEEKILFPALKRAVPDGRVRIVYELETEHEPIKAKVMAFRAQTEGLYQAISVEKQKAIIGLCKDVLSLAVPHSRRENEIIPPLIKAFFKAEDYQRVEEQYYQFIRQKPA